MTGIVGRAELLSSLFFCLTILVYYESTCVAYEDVMYTNETTNKATSGNINTGLGRKTRLSHD